jgi:hypothetical protein
MLPGHNLDDTSDDDKKLRLILVQVSTACGSGRVGSIKNAKLKMQKAKVKIADSEFYIFHFALSAPARLRQVVLTYRESHS